MTSKNELLRWVLGERFFLNMGKGWGIRWSLASDASGVTADVVHPSPSSPDSNFLSFVFSITGNGGGRSGGIGGQ